MATKRSGKLPPAPAAHSEEESSSSEPLAIEEEEGEAQVQTSETPSQPKQSPSSSGSESESESRSESESESETKTPPQPATETLNSRKPKPPLPTPSKSPTLKKRRNESEPAKKPDSKKKRKTSHEVRGTEDMDGPSSEKKPLFQRLWSDEDEVALLQGMVDFVEREGVDPSNRMNVFSEFVKKYVSVDATQAQLLNKVRGMKKKFKKNRGKGENGHDKGSKNLHSQKAWGLMKKLWSDDKNMVLLKRDDDKDVVEKTGIEESMCLIETSRLFPNFVDKSFRKGLTRIGERKRLELEEDWMKLKVAEMKIIDEQIALFRKQNRLIIGALSSKY